MWLEKLEGIECLLDIKAKIKTKIDKIKIINDNLYLYVIDNSIMIYDYKTFEQKAVLNLPFEFKNLSLEILENEVLVYLIGNRLYFYKINIKEKNLTFMLYILYTCNFCYLEKKKEIFLLLKKYIDEKPFGIAKCDLNGNIIFFNNKKPKISYEFTVPGKNNYSIPSQVNSIFGSFNKLDGFNNDNYIINISGKIYNFYDYKIQFSYIALENDIKVYNTEGKELLIWGISEQYLNYKKIADNLFQADRQERLFYYNEKKNRIIFINNILDYINNEIDEEKNLEEEEKYIYYLGYGLETIMNENNKIPKYFYLSDKMFAIYDTKFHLFLIDITNEKKIIRKINLNWIGGNQTNSEIKNIYYTNSNGEEHLYISFQETKNNKKEEFIIHGIIKEKKD